MYKYVSINTYINIVFYIYIVYSILYNKILCIYTQTHTYSEILFSLKKEDSVIFNNIDEPRRQYLK